VGCVCETAETESAAKRGVEGEGVVPEEGAGEAESLSLRGTRKRKFRQWVVDPKNKKAYVDRRAAKKGDLNSASCEYRLFFFPPHNILCSASRSLLYTVHIVEANQTSVWWLTDLGQLLQATCA
jgi:hypothetical protein